MDAPRLQVVLMIRSRLLFGFVVLNHDRRRIVHIAATYHPTAEWIARQINEAFPWDSAPQYLLRDCDCAYGNVFRKLLLAMGIRDRPVAPRSSWQNGGACPRLDRGSNVSSGRSGGTCWTM